MPRENAKRPGGNSEQSHCAELGVSRIDAPRHSASIPYIRHSLPMRGLALSLTTSLEQIGPRTGKRNNIMEDTYMLADEPLHPYPVISVLELVAVTMKRPRQHKDRRP